MARGGRRVRSHHSWPPDTRDAQARGKAVEAAAQRGASLGAQGTCDRCDRLIAHRYIAPVAPDRSFCPRCFDLLTQAWIPLAIRAGELDSRYREIYGMKLEEYGARFLQQSGRCAICTRAHPDLPGAGLLVVDHAHDCCSGPRSCGRCVRGLLCNSCNMAIGLLNERVSHFTRAILYLDRPRRLKLSPRR